MNGKPVTAVLPLVLLLMTTQSKGEPFRLIWSEEATIADIHATLKAKELTCRQLVQRYIDRIEAYDKKGPALNAVIMINPNALATADALDARFTQSGAMGPLHCVPIIVKDNYDTTDFGAVGLGTDTGNSIRGPSSHTTVFPRAPAVGLRRP